MSRKKDDDDNWDWTKDEDWTPQEEDVFSPDDEWMCEFYENADTPWDEVEIQLIQTPNEKHVVQTIDIVTNDVIHSMGPYSSLKEAELVYHRLLE